MMVVGWCGLGLIFGLTVFYALYRRKLGGELKARLRVGVDEWISNQKMEKEGPQGYKGVSGVRVEDGVKETELAVKSGGGVEGGEGEKVEDLESEDGVRSG